MLSRLHIRNTLRSWRLNFHLYSNWTFTDKEAENPKTISFSISGVGYIVGSPITIHFFQCFLAAGEDFLLPWFKPLSRATFVTFFDVADPNRVCLTSNEKIWNSIEFSSVSRSRSLPKDLNTQKKFYLTKENRQLLTYLL